MPSGEAKPEKLPRWTMTERLLAVLAAFLSVIAGGLGIWGADASAERDELATTTDSLADERDSLASDRDQLVDDLEAAQARIEELEEELATPTTIQPPDDEPGTAAPLPGEPTFLNQLEPVSGTANVDETELGGQRYRNVVRQDLVCLGTSATSTVEYNLGAGYDTFTALAGLHDTTVNPSDIWRFAVTTIDANGEHIVFEQEIRFAAPVPIDVPVAGAQRLRLSVQEVDVDGEQYCSARDENAAVWADPKIA
ncbi:MAG TPA: NPCBM/NEW2 domain-containing protein [Acidimicrobiales bacterium]